MTFIEKIRLIERLDGLIKRKATGRPEDLASKLGVARSTVYELIECMRSMDAEIDYCKEKQTFIYLCEKELSIGFVRSDKVRGGNNYKNNSTFFGLSDFFGHRASTFTKSSYL